MISHASLVETGQEKIYMVLMHPFTLAMPQFARLVDAILQIVMAIGRPQRCLIMLGHFMTAWQFALKAAG